MTCILSIPADYIASSVERFLTETNEPSHIVPNCFKTPNHRLISRDRLTKTGRLCLCGPFFYVAALNVRICRVVDGEWGDTISVEENF